MAILYKHMEQDLLARFPCGATWWKVQHAGADIWQQAFYDGVVKVADPRPSKLVSDSDTRPRDMPRNSRSATEMLTPICEYIMERIDPCASLYTKMQKTDALQWLKQRLFNFVSSDAHLYLGPKKSRVLSMWLSGNSCKPDSETIIREFIELLLGETAKEIVLHIDRRGNWFVKSGS